MKNTSKILVLVLALAMMFTMASMFTASAAETRTIYLDAGGSALWDQAGAIFRAWTWGGSQADSWAYFTDADGDGIYEAEVYADRTDVIFLRAKSGSTAWNDEWNRIQTKFSSSANLFTITDWSAGSWSTYGNDCTHANLSEAATCTTAQTCLDCGDPVVAALGHAYNDTHYCTRCETQAIFTVAGTGAHMNGEWQPGNTANDMTFADGVYTKVYTNVAAGDYKLKCLQNHDWTTNFGGIGDYADTEGNYLYSVATAGSTVTVTLTGTTVNVVVEAPHVNALVIGENNKIVVDDSLKNPLDYYVAVVPFTVTEKANYTLYAPNLDALALVYNADASVCYTNTTTGVATLEAGTYYVWISATTPLTTGTYYITVLQTEYVEPLPEGTYVLESKNLEAKAAGSYEDGSVVSVDDFFTLILGAKSKIDTSDKTWKEDPWGDLAYESGQRLYLGGKTSITANAIKFTTTKPATVTVWWVSNDSTNDNAGSGARPVGILDAEGNIVVQDTTTVAKNAVHVSTFELEVAGTYYLGNMVDNNYFYKVQVVEKEESVTPEHENKLVIGENNKIVVDGSAVNQNNNPIAWVPFVVEEKALYTFASETENALVYIFNSDFSMPGGALTSAAILEPGTYLICVGNGAVGDIYVTVTKSEVPAECEHEYVYMNCKLCGALNPHFAYNLMVVGTNKVICNEYHLVDTKGHGNPYQFTTFTVTEDGHYKFTADKLVGFTIFTTEVNAEGADWTAGTGVSWGEYIAGTEADLKAGTYYVGLIFVDGVGEYSITLELVPPHTHTWSDATCTEPAKCECGETQGEALGHDYKDGVCTRCEAADPDYEAPVEPQPEPNFFQKIVAWIMDLIKKILGVFKR